MTTSVIAMRLSEIFKLNLPEQLPEKSTRIGTLPRKVLVGFSRVFHQLFKGVESFDLSLVHQIYKIDVRFVNGL
jgi:hypothetical protein